VVQKVVKSDVKSGVSKTSGKPYTVYSFVIDGTIDGASVSGVGLSTMSKDGAAQVKEGFATDVESKVWNNITSYTFTPAKTGGFGGGGGGYRSAAPAASYSKDELEALYAWCLITADKHLKDVIKEAQLITAQDVQAGAATLLIAAQKCGLKV
jgi:hypothetical protein